MVNPQRQRPWKLCWSLMGMLLWGQGAIAAETVVLNYRSHQAPVAVADLTTLVKTGEVSSDLEDYLALAKLNPRLLQWALGQEIRMKQRYLDQALNHPLGGFFLDQLALTVHTPSQGADRQALRAALVLATEDDKLSLLEILEQYPTAEVHIEADRILETRRQLEGVEQWFPKWLSS